MDPASLTIIIGSATILYCMTHPLEDKKVKADAQQSKETMKASDAAKEVLSSATKPAVAPSSPNHAFANKVMSVCSKDQPFSNRVDAKNLPSQPNPITTLDKAILSLKKTSNAYKDTSALYRNQIFCIHEESKNGPLADECASNKTSLAAEIQHSNSLVAKYNKESADLCHQSDNKALQADKDAAKKEYFKVSNALPPGYDLLSDGVTYSTSTFAFAQEALDRPGYSYGTEDLTDFTVSCAPGEHVLPNFMSKYTGGVHSCLSNLTKRALEVVTTSAEEIVYQNPPNASNTCYASDEQPSSDIQATGVLSYRTGLVALGAIAGAAVLTAGYKAFTSYKAKAAVKAAVMENKSKVLKELAVDKASAAVMFGNALEANEAKQLKDANIAIIKENMEVNSTWKSAISKIDNVILRLLNWFLYAFPFLFTVGQFDKQKDITLSQAEAKYNKIREEARVQREELVYDAVLNELELDAGIRVRPEDSEEFKPLKKEAEAQRKELVDDAVFERFTKDASLEALRSGRVGAIDEARNILKNATVTAG